MSVGYAIAYRLGITPWERAGEAGAEGFEALLAREASERSQPLGRALDLGCGRGQHTNDLARLGWEAVGLDNIPRAVGAAEAGAQPGATFTVGDVTALDPAALGTFDFFLDIGCFHGLTPDERRAEGRGVTALANPGATILMLAFQVNGVVFIPGGATREDVTSAFPAWTLVSVEPADTSGMPKPLRRTAPQWYRLRLS